MRGLTLVEQITGLEGLDLSVLTEPRELLVIELLEQEQRAQFADVTCFDQRCGCVIVHGLVLTPLATTADDT
jgi:hypothetical protein